MVRFYNGNNIGNEDGNVRKFYLWVHEEAMRGAVLIAGCLLDVEVELMIIAFIRIINVPKSPT